MLELLHGIGKFFSNNFATILGAFLPVLGSVFLIFFEKKVGENRQYTLYVRRICELIKYNIEIAHARIINNNMDIEFTQEDMHSILNAMEDISVKKSKSVFNDVFELAFSIHTDEQLLMNFDRFYETVFVKSRKNKASFYELSRIIESIGISNVYEFKTLYRLIVIARKLKIETAFDQYYAFVKKLEPETDFDSCMLYYIVELIEQHNNGKSNRLYYLGYFMEKYGRPDDRIKGRMSKINGEEREAVGEIRARLKHYSDIIHDFHGDELWTDFLAKLNSESITLEAEGIEDISADLNEIFNEDSKVYLSFLGICCNGDALDNNGRSRQKENREHPEKKPYRVTERGWYKETLEDGPETVTVTTPYVDTSLSYVISFVKKFMDKDEVTGVLGLDVVVDDLLYGCRDHENLKLIFFTADGQIIYDSERQNSAKKLFFNNVFLKENVQLLQLIHRNETGCFEMDLLEKVYFTTIVENKYYCLIR